MFGQTCTLQVSVGTTSFCELQQGLQMQVFEHAAPLKVSNMLIAFFELSLLNTTIRDREIRSIIIYQNKQVSKFKYVITNCSQGAIHARTRKLLARLCTFNGTLGITHTSCSIRAQGCFARLLRKRNQAA